MQQIHLSQPCDVPVEQMTATANGWHCAHCAKEVVDYSGMTDAQILAHISKHGLGCGSFLPAQLDRELIRPIKRRTNIFVYAYALALAFIFKNEPASAQVNQQIEQVPCKQRSYDNLNIIDTTARQKNYRITETRIFGGVIGIRKTYKAYRIPFTKLFFVPKKFKFTRNPV